MKGTLFFAALLGMSFFLISASDIKAQSAKEIAFKSSGDMRLLITFGRMERAVSDVDSLLSHAIVASAGSWEVVSETSNAELVRAKAKDAHGVAERSNATVHNSKVSTGFQKARSEEIVAHLADMLLAVAEIADALEADDLDLARTLYQSEYQVPFGDAIRVARSSTTELEKSLSGTLFRLSVAQ